MAKSKAKHKIPDKWHLSATPQHYRQNMERAMGGKIERALVELITNSDDNYQDLEDEGKRVLGKIRIEIERKRKGQPTLVVVRDRAGGMSREELYYKLGKLGRRTSGFEEGKPRRGLHGRGARDVAAFGKVHFESIKAGEYNHLIIPLSLECYFTEPRPMEATGAIREKLGISRGNGTVVTIDVESRWTVPKHETLVEDFSRYYSLRDIFSDPAREVIIVDKNRGKIDPLSYTYPEGGKVVFDDPISIPGYPKAKAHLVIREYPTSFNRSFSPSLYREGILIRSPAGIHSCTYFGLEQEPLSWRFSGVLDCEFIDDLIREYDNRYEANPNCPGHTKENPMRLLDPLREGLIQNHPFAQKMYQRGREILQEFVEAIKACEMSSERGVTNKDLDKKLANLSEEISKVFEKEMEELEEEIPLGNGDEPPIGLHIIPPGEMPIIVKQPKIFTVRVKHDKALEESLPIEIISSNPTVIKVESSQVYFRRLSEDRSLGSATFTVEGIQVGAEATIEVYYGGYSSAVGVKVIEPPPPSELPEGLSFDKPQYHLRLNREKELIVWLKLRHRTESPIVARVTSDHPKIVVKGGGRCQLRETEISGVLRGRCRLVGRQSKAKGVVRAQTGSKIAETRVTVGERVEGAKLKFEPDERDFSPLRYKWDERYPNLLKIGAKHPSIRKYLGDKTEQGYQKINSPLYHAVLAEVIAEALAFRILQVQFRKEGEQEKLDYDAMNYYYHETFSKHLSITHKHLVTEGDKAST